MKNLSDKKLLMPPTPSLPNPTLSLSSSVPEQISPSKPAPLMRWRVYAHEPNKEILWGRLAIIGIAVLILAGIFILQKNYTGATTLLIAGALAALFVSRRPPIISCELYPESVIFQKDKYPFSSLQNFALTFDRLILFPKQDESNIQIPIEPDERDDIRSMLAPRLEEIEYDPTLLDFLHNFFKI